MSVGTITRGSIATCETNAGGTRARIILINFADVSKVYSNDDGKIIEIVMRSGTVGYEFSGFRNDVKKSEEIEKTQQHKKRFRHNCSFVVYEVDQIQKNNLKRLAKGRVIAITETLGQGEDSIEMLGRDCGLQIMEGQIRSASENSGVFLINLGTPDNGREYERKLPQTLGVDYDQGQSIINDILELTPEDGIFDETFDSTFE